MTHVNSGTGGWVTAKELAEILNVPVSWVYQRTQHGSKAIPFLKVGRYVRFNVQETIEFLKVSSGRILESQG